MYSALLESKIEDEKWTDEVWEKELAKIPSWQSIIGALGKSPPVEIKQSEPLFDSLPWKEIPSYRESPVPH
jgi:hypothetical protein